MAPIYDTDVASERWEKDEWRHYELWEKIELRLRKQRRIWILAALVVFLILSSVPTLMRRNSKWKTMEVGSEIAKRIEQLKMKAVVTHHPHRIRFSGEGSLEFRIEKTKDCQSEDQGEVVDKGSIGVAENGRKFVLLNAKLAETMNIPFVVETFCYDPLGRTYEDVRVFAVANAKSLTEETGSIDRYVTLVTLSGKSAEISLD